MATDASSMDANPEEEKMSAEDAALEREFAALLDQHLPGSEHHREDRGELVEVTVVAVKEDTVLVDLGGKAEANIPLEEFPLANGVRAVKVGDVIPVVQTGKHEDGSPRVSHRQARFRAAQKNVRDALEQKVPIRGTVSAVVKGGIMIDVGLDAFMPASQIDLFKIPDLNQLVGTEIEAYVLEFDPRRHRAVLSRRQLLFERRESQRSGFITKLEPGSVVKGKVKAALDFGVFIDLGIVDGFIPREEVSWDRGKSPAESLPVGSEVEVKVVNVNPDTGKITLSRRRLRDNPWDVAEQRYPKDSIVRGRIVAVQAYGAFVQLDEGITGMIHATDMAWAAGNKNPSDYVRVGDEVTAQVLEISREKKRLSLGLKQLMPDPWQAVAAKYTPGLRVKGTITSLTNYGAFVKLEEGVEGMVHVSDITWEKRVGHPKEYLKAGDEIEAAVMKVDGQNRRISLGIKQLADSPYDAFLKAHPVGSVITGKVTRFAPFGAFVELAPGLEGLIHISQIDDKRVELPEKALKLGEEVTVKILKAEAKNQKISLSRKEAARAAERENIKAYMKSSKSEQKMGTSLGDALRAAREKKE